jgi:DNA repair protein RadC
MIETVEIVSIKLVREGELRTQYDERISSSQRAYELAKSFIGDRDREYGLVITLDIKLQVNSISVVSIGSIGQAIVHPREVFKTAILHNAASIIFSHNHPSGNLEPSPEDRKITERLVEAGKILGIELLDHIIVSESSYYSFKDKGIL